ncbi:PREDICTED: neuropeptide-like 3 [Polistes dominula]|uniref:Neuropeptide-like 3 n=1 Tax=Polistes dominula TaxID=743375 RepID=A0ABM1HZM3_POLDO|nr:PREDICTED: neuropeptide-like 3 [Polistes dominula]
MFKLFLFGAFLAFAAAAPAPAPAPAPEPAPGFQLYNGIGALPLLRSADTPLIYSKTYSAPSLYNYPSPIINFPLVYKTGYY